MSRTAAPRAIAHWAWRMFRRDWRQQALVLTLLTIAVTVSSYSAALGHAVAPSDQSSFGTASGRIRFTTNDTPLAATVVSQASQSFGTVEEITDTSVSIPGSVQHLDLRVQRPDGAFASSTIRLRSGRYPASEAEIALTTGLSLFLDAPVGATITIGKRALEVVGLIENPSRLDDAFALVTAHGAGEQVQHTLLVRASAARLASFRSRTSALAPLTIDRPTYYSHDLGVLLVAALGMMLVAVLALTSFLVLSQRRVRQLGMIAAVGATQRQVRNVTVFHGLIVGAIAGSIGTVVAGLAWAATGPVLALASGRRVSWSSVPLWLILTPGLMALLSSVAAAWWPARTMARVPVVRALSNRPVDPTPGRRSAAAVAVSLAVGVLCLRYAHQRNPVLMIGGLGAMIGAVLLTTPLAIRAAVTRSGRLPIALRLAWRDLGRNQARSAAALATVTMAVGMSVSAVVITAANVHAPTAGNLSARQVLIHANDSRDPGLIPPRATSQTESMDSAIDQLASTVSQAQVIELSVAFDPAAEPSPEARATGDLDAVQVVRQHGQQFQSFPVYVATSQLLATLGGVATSPDQARLMAADPTGTWSLLTDRQVPFASPGRLSAAKYSSLPTVLASPALLQQEHWTQIRAGWLVQTPTPLTGQQFAQWRRQAATLGVAVEGRDQQTYLGRLRLMFTIGGIIVTLAVIAIALVLLRTQTIRDQQILTAVGTPRRIRRAISAAAGTTLAALGTLLGITGAYLTLILAYSDTLHRLENIPASALTAIALGIPLLTFATSWLTSAREPRAINRPVIE